MYFVTLCTTTSAPERERPLQRRRRERVVDDDARAGLVRDARDTAAMSTIFSSGFEGVSTHTKRGPRAHRRRQRVEIGQVARS